MKIKFGTDGWRAIIGQEYTTANVARVAKATALWLKNTDANKKVVIGHDARFGGQLFAETAAKVIADEGIQVILADAMISTPMLSLACNYFDAGIGVVITASHNPPAYNGYKLKSNVGGPSSPKVISEVEALIEDEVEIPDTTIDKLMATGNVQKVNMEDLYFQQVQKKFDIDKINHSPLVIAYDAMFGAGQNIVPRILSNLQALHCEDNPGFKGRAPEPLHKNLPELSKLIAESSDIPFGFANDGDADRIGVYDGDGHFVDSHHVLLLLIKYLHKYKKLNGKVVVSFTVSGKIKKLCQKYGLDYEVTPVGFKYISEIMVAEDVLVGGEESGGIAVKGHIPERDGIWNALLLIEYMAETEKTIKELVDDIHEEIGSFAFDRYDLHLTEDQKQKAVHKCQNNEFLQFGNYTVQSIEDIDGWKYHLDDDTWLMIRPSGTEPVLRVYCESRTHEEVIQILDIVKQIIDNL
ncbi:MAG: phosphoglucomutase/phosphomannomutase family protein [Chitinophagales bacterium]|nr:phosphoglucomutase/phosphomannomutase family protein [Chitinophagales bacterium]